MLLGVLISDSGWARRRLTFRVSRSRRQWEQVKQYTPTCKKSLVTWLKSLRKQMHFYLQINPRRHFYLRFGNVYFFTAHLLVYKNEIEIEEAFSKATQLIWCSQNIFRSAHTSYTFKPRFVPFWSTCEKKCFHNVLEQWQHPINTIKTIKQIHKVFRGGMSGVVQMRNTTNGDKQWRKNTTLANQHPQ